MYPIWISSFHLDLLPRGLQRALTACHTCVSTQLHSVLRMRLSYLNCFFKRPLTYIPTALHVVPWTRSYLWLIAGGATRGTHPIIW